MFDTIKEILKLYSQLSEQAKWQKQYDKMKVRDLDVALLRKMIETVTQSDLIEMDITFVDGSKATIRKRDAFDEIARRRMQQLAEGQEFQR